MSLETTEVKKTRPLTAEEKYKELLARAYSILFVHTGALIQERKP